MSRSAIGSPYARRALMMTPPWVRRVRRGARRGVAFGVAFAVAVSTIGQTPAFAAPARPFEPATPKVVPAVRTTTAHGTRAPVDQARPASARPKAAWPGAGARNLTVPAVAGTATTEVGTLPVAVTAPREPAARPPAGAAAAVASTVPAKVRVQVLDRAATDRSQTRGVLLRVGRADGAGAAGQVNVAVDYSGFATAYGGDWANRLRLVRLPECALTAPDRPECAGTALPTRNDSAARRVSADVTIGKATNAAGAGDTAADGAGAALLAVAAGTSGPTGSFAATTLSSSSNWSAGGSSGDFSWSYPMRIPPSQGGPMPSVDLTYSSQSVDGRMAASNNQPSVVGEGFELATGGYIERRYKGCGDDMAADASGAKPNNTTKTGDECWATDNATMNLNGHSTELIRDNGDVNRWHPRADDGSRIERRTGAANGDEGVADAEGVGGAGEWWVVTTVNGTQYWFGRNRLPGWSDGRPETRSTWTMPVFGNHPGEPCHATTFAASACMQAWRWNLDYVVDPHGNTMSFWYTPDTGYYAKNLVTSEPVTYTRGGLLDRVDYGTRVVPDLDTGTDTTFTGQVADRVEFGYGDRCLGDCATHDDTHWPDTPWDLDCGASSCQTTSPVFWTTRRLTTVTTKVWSATTSAFYDVERWTLTHGFPDPGDTTRAGLWLEKISHSGLVGTEVKLPDVTFTGVAMDNRVDAVDTAPAMSWRRIESITTETGGLITVYYSAPDCVAGSRVPSATALESNTLRCYPVKWTREGYTTPTLDFFHKYLVTDVTETDLTTSSTAGGSPRVLHHYSYLDDPAWHYSDDDGLISAEDKTWSQWRGYAKVGVTEGDPGEQTYRETLYLRGMHGDHLPGGATRSVSVTDSEGGSVVDEDPLAGTVREQRTFDGPGGQEISGSISDPWLSAPVATRTINGVTVASRYASTQATHNRTTLDNGRGVRRTSTRNQFDGYGMPVRVDDFGDDAVTGDEQCTVTTYEPRNTAAWLMSLPQRVQTFALTCDQVAAGPVTADDVIGDGRTSYDGNPWGVSPNLGDPTLVEQLDGYADGEPSYTTVSRSVYDAQGRVVQSWDAMGYRSATSYTPATGGPVTQTVDTNPLGWTTTSVLEPAWGSATATIDPNQLRTDLAYDALGRLTAVWLPDRPKAANTANMTYEYLVRGAAGPTAVITRTLNPAGNYLASYAIYDGLLRDRQTQTDSPTDGGRLLTDVFYDSAGRPSLTFGSYYDTSPPGPELAAVVDKTTVPKQTRVVYDGAGRTIASIFQPYGDESNGWRTSTAYGGDRVDVTPPAGGTATSTITDARERTVELRQYHGPTPTPTVAGSYDATTYAFNRRGLMDRVTNAAGEQWSYGYDLRGRQTSTSDPDKGTSTSTYDANGRVVSTTDARGVTLVYDYDQLGRKRGVYRDSLSGARLTGWTYDATPIDWGRAAKGQLSSSTRYVTTGGTTAKYTVSVDGYNKRYQPSSSTVTIPSTETGLSGSYTYLTAYKPDGSPESVTYPTVGDVSIEMATLGYNDLGLPVTLLSNLSNYVSGAEYNALAEPQKYTFTTAKAGTSGKKLYELYVRDLATGRLQNTVIQRDSVTPNTVADLHYDYTPAGDITKVADTPAGGATDIQCFRYDHLQRLTEAWTPAADDCGPDPATSALGGPARYWLSWSYDVTGRRTQQVDHATTQGQTTTTYGYPGGPEQPHTLTSTTTETTAGSTLVSSVTAGYTYDVAGNTTQRPGVDGDQTLTWDAEGRLESTTDDSGGTQYVYDADGNRLIRRDATGKTLYLPDSELRYTTATGAKTCTRFYSFGGGVIAQRTAAGLTWLVGDHHGTQQLAVDDKTQQVTQRRETPFGTERGASVTWPNEKGFVGGTADPTGLTHLGAREYDPGIGRFVSVDPVATLDDPQQLQGYSYAGNNPVTDSDPSGEMAYGGGGSGGLPDDAAATPAPAPDPGPATTGGTNGKGGGNKNKKPKKCQWWNQLCIAKQAVVQAANWVDDHKAAVAGFVASVAVGVGCGFAIGWTGVGAVACGALAGAVGSMVSYAVETKVEGKGEFSLGGMLKQGAIGAVVGGAMGGLGAVAGAALKAGASTVVNGGVRAAFQAGARAGGQEARSIASGLTRGMIGKGAAGGAKSGAAAGGRGGGCSFASTVPVLLADGSAKPIGQVEVGDEVLATDPETGDTESEQVTTLFLHLDVRLADVTVTDASGASAVVPTTQNHPFWSETRHAWILAADLQPGEHLRDSSGSPVTVTAVRPYTGHHGMHTLTVASLHTYYVIAGTTPVLVHNCDPGSAAKLRDALNNAGDLEPSTPHSPHHIVAGNSPKAAPARAQLDRFGIGVNDAENGVWLPRSSSSPNPNGASVHSRVHTNEYYDYVNDLMDGARSRSEALDVINHVRGQLLGGYWP